MRVVSASSRLSVTRADLKGQEATEPGITEKQNPCLTRGYRQYLVMLPYPGRELEAPGASRKIMRRAAVQAAHMQLTSLDG
jgi:hypothetical protein